MKKSDVLRHNRDFYSEYAHVYDDDRASFYIQEAKRVRRDLDWIEMRRPVSSMCVADIGCGTGFYSCEIAARGASSFYCVDLNEEFLKQARQKLADTVPGVRNVVTLERDAETFVDELELLENSPDLFVFGTVLQYVPNHCDLLVRLLESRSRAIYYITGTQVPYAHQYRRLESLTATVDYQLHKLRRPGGVAKLESSSKVTVDVDNEKIEALFSERGFETWFYRYSPFHTGLGHLLHRGLRSLVPRLGSCFTLIAHRD